MDGPLFNYCPEFICVFLTFLFLFSGSTEKGQDQGDACCMEATLHSQTEDFNDKTFSFDGWLLTL